MGVSEVNPEPTQVWPPASEPPPWTAPRPRRLLVHLLLFLVTVLTTTVAGAFLAGADIIREPGLLYRGLPFSLSLLAILGAHEMGHYLVSRRHGLDVSLPYFLPGLPFPPLPGTFGALIRIRSPILDKRALMDVGVSGPLCGLAVAVPVLTLGLMFSRATGPLPGAGETFQLGEPLLFKLLGWLVLGATRPEDLVILHPVAFAGWLGLLITSLNLLPVGQLDGGHIVYALFPSWHRRISIACVLILAVLGVLTWPGWLFWAVIMTLLGLRHPPPYCDWIPLGRGRRLLGACTLVVFLLTFMPTPLKLG